jgi:hypothetical protein
MRKSVAPDQIARATQLTAEETSSLRSQIATLKVGRVCNLDVCM